MKKQNLWLILVTILITSLAAGCAGGGTPAPEQSAAEEGVAQEVMAEEETMEEQEVMAEEETTEEQEAMAEEESMEEKEVMAEEESMEEKEAMAEEETMEEKEAMAEEEAMEGEGTFLERAKAGEFSGTEVNIFGVYTAEDEISFEETLAPFIEETDIQVNFEGSADFEQLIVVRLEADDAPDLTIASQPGLIADFARDGYTVDLSTILNMDKLNADYSQAWLDLGSLEDGNLFGVFYRASTKSLVWYPTPQFEEAGYKVPTTWDEMIALSDQMVADGNTPWCISIEHSGNTGWVGTDWLEDILLRTAPAEVYDQWVAHEIPFNAPEIKNAWEIMEQIWLNPDYVYGGTTNILTQWVGDTPKPMFDEPKPSCWMHRQAGWIPAFFPEGKVAGEDASFFYLPPIDPDIGNAVLGAGDLVSMYNDRPEVRAVLQYLASPEGAEVWVKKGGFLSPNASVPADWYANDVDLRQAEILANADVFRFDASDSMPGEVGTGTFFQGVVDWLNGESIEEVLQDIEASWPTE
jgi:alpha-glucoside transport system substrate-binding protein